MFELHPPIAYAAVALVTAVAGFGWSFGCWLFAWCARPHRRDTTAA